jgi:GNAT superfamily N-acetyltransferase
MFEQTKPREQSGGLSEVLFRIAEIDDLDLLFAIDRDASRLFQCAGLDMALADELELAAAERRRWLECLRSGTAVLATNRSGESIGFAALGVLVGEPYLEQLSVRMHAMRRGVGAALLTAAVRMAEEARAQSLWLTTYGHLPWNRPFYEKAGFGTVPPEQWGREIAQEVRFQRRLLPAPARRVVMRRALGTPG